ncbi:MAG TPA: TIGR03435 family protein [Bryobacteraceae bacterium]|nr:TIGR03435 family protein [Bryobacteraceae bacterium]
MRPGELGFCIQQAYAVPAYQVSGPKRILGARYDITAALPRGSRPDEVGQAWQTLITERFELALRGKGRRV